MNLGLKIFTILFALMCFENTFRVSDFIGEWSHSVDQSDDSKDDDEIFCSDYSHQKLVERKEAGPGALV